MDLDVDVDAELDKGGVRFGERDADLLWAVADHGSLNGAADALGRSYSRSQQRVVELEAAFGRLVERQRGGADGGGSSLTDTATALLAEFARIETEFAEVTDVEETVFAGTVVARDGELGTVETAAGPVRAVVPTNTDDVWLTVRADAVTLHAPGSVPERETSARNQFRGEVRTVTTGDAVARVALDVGADTDLTVLVTRASVDTLALAPGTAAVATFKATATRAYPTAESHSG